MGVAAVLGAGVFSTIGNAAASGGPAVVFLFIFTAVACGFSALCYAEFASAIPVAGSAYTYAYASFGEFVAWIIGWDLLMEYAIGNIAMAISWSQYFTGLLASYDIHIPSYLTMNLLSAWRGYCEVSEYFAHQTLHTPLTDHASVLTPWALKCYRAWLEAPQVFGIHLILDLPALAIVILITWIVYRGIEESKRTSNILVTVKIAVVLLVICVGASYVHTENWVPFAPNGVSGVLKGVSAVFFAYIGFDAISTTAEECKNPQRDLPRGMIYSLLICTALYTLTALILTGMMSYHKLGVGDPLAFVFGPEGVNLPWVCGIVNISALVALATVLLVFQVGQPRIWMVMSRDGLLPPIFAAIHPRFRTPWFSTLVTGAVVAIPSLFMSLTEVTDLTSIGTLFAFILVCGASLRMNFSQAHSTRHDAHPGNTRKFKTPYINSRYIFPLMILGIVLGFLIWYPDRLMNTLPFSFSEGGLFLDTWEVFQHKIPILVFALAMTTLSYFCFTRRLSLIPVLGLTTCSYLMTELGITNWIRFGAWLILGFCIYFSYGIRHSKLNWKAKTAHLQGGSLPTTAVTQGK
jgi:amino acid transporter